MSRINSASSFSKSHNGFFSKAFFFNLLPLAMTATQIMVFLFSLKYSIFPEASDWKSIVGTCAEIIAGLYGITTAGYTFFLSRIDALTATDASLDFLVDRIKHRFKYLIWFITINVLMTLLVSIVLMYGPVPSGENTVFVYRLFCNEFLVFLTFSITLILIYSIMVIDPNCIRKEAKRQKIRLEGSGAVPGNVVEFIAMYDRIQKLSRDLLPEAVLDQVRENKGCRFELTLELLQTQYPQMYLLSHDLKRVHRYYECVINTSPLRVSADMCNLVARVLFVMEKLSGNTPQQLSSGYPAKES